MAQPTPYERQFAFSGQPKATWAEGLENELNAVKVTSDETLANIELIQRDDGKLRNGIVTRDSLAPDLALAGLVALDFADEATSIAGEADNVAMAPLGVKQQIDARLSDQPTAEAGSDNSALMTPLRTAQQIDARIADEATAEAGTDNVDLMTSLRARQGQDIPIRDLTALPDYGLGPPEDPPLLPFGASGAKQTLFSETDDVRPGGALATFAIIRHAHGSGDFGPQDADIAVWLHVEKKDYLTSNVEGEIDTVSIVARQGRKGDVSPILINVEKVITGTGDDTGGVSAGEFRVAGVDASAQTQRALHSLPAFIENVAGISAGKGYGHYVETRKGTWYAAYYAGNTSSPVSEGANTFEKFLVAAEDRDLDSVFFEVDWSTGTIHVGKPANRRSLAYDPATDVLSIKDETSSDIWKINAAGEPTYVGDAWTSYSPTLSATSGTLTSAGATGAYRRLGKNVFFNVRIAITTNGTAAGKLVTSLPVTPAGASFNRGFAHSGASIVTNKGLCAFSYGAAPDVLLTFADGTYPGADGEIFVVSGVYEAA